MLYIADEVFFTGTAAEVTPIRSVDRIPVGSGRRGPVTERIQKDFFGLLRGDLEDRYGWLTPVPTESIVDSR
jgi:branched-chain amino acid aminotransferase